MGDSWFNSQRLRLPDGCEYEVQMRYGSIGWSVGSTLGYCFASGPKSRVLSAAVPNGLDKPEVSKRVCVLEAARPTCLATSRAHPPLPLPSLPAAAGPASLHHASLPPPSLQVSKRVLTLVGDGSFQMTAQDVSTMLRYSLTPIIILVRACVWGGEQHSVGCIVRIATSLP